MDPNHLLSAFPLLSTLFGLNTSWHAFVRGMQGGGGCLVVKRGACQACQEKSAKKEERNKLL